MQPNAHSPVRDFRELKVWQKAHKCVLASYRTTSTCPTEERFGLTSQRRRAAASVPSNIAEGCGVDGDRELARFLSIAAGCASDVAYRLLLRHDLSLLDDEPSRQLDTQINEVKRMLNAFIRKLREWLMAKSVTAGACCVSLCATGS